MYLENDEIKLKVQSLYFYQVQGQLKITKRDLCHFVIHTDSWTQILKIKFDLSFRKTKMKEQFIEIVIKKNIIFTYNINCPTYLIH